MAKKKLDLAHALKKHDNRAPAPAAEKAAPAARPDNPHYRPSREGAENLTGYFPPAVKIQLVQIALKKKIETGQRLTIQDQMAEALNYYFAKNGMPEIAPLARKEGQG